MEQLNKFLLDRLWFEEVEGDTVISAIEMNDLVATIAKMLVDKPDQVIASEIKGQQVSVIELKVAKEDVGKIIGKQGRTANALRDIIMAASAKTRNNPEVTTLV